MLRVILDQLGFWDAGQDLAGQKAICRQLVITMVGDAHVSSRDQLTYPVKSLAHAKLPFAKQRRITIELTGPLKRSTRAAGARFQLRRTRAPQRRTGPVERLVR